MELLERFALLFLFAGGFAGSDIFEALFDGAGDLVVLVHLPSLAISLRIEDMDEIRKRLSS